jgi:hypothetical protein
LIFLSGQREKINFFNVIFNMLDRRAGSPSWIAELDRRLQSPLATTTVVAATVACRTMTARSIRATLNACES